MKALRRLSFLLTLLVLGAIPGYAQVPVWFDQAKMRGFKTDLPDFYQHQYWCDRPDWEASGGWCRPTAIVDSLYYWKANGYDFPGFLSDDISKKDKWQAASCDAITKLRNLQSSGYKNFFEMTGHGEKSGVGPGKGLTFTQYSVNPANGKVTYVSSDGTTKMTTGTAFDVYKRELLDGQDVMIRWSAAPRKVNGKNVNYDNSLWWRGPNPDDGNYHYVTGAGVDCKTKQIFFADPDSNKGSTKAQAGWDPLGKDKCPKPALDKRKYTPDDHAPPVPERGSKVTDDPKNRDKFYGGVTIGADGFTVTGSERYHDVRIRQIETICPLKAVKKNTKAKSLSTEFLSDFALTSGPVSTIDSVILYPTAAVDSNLLPDSMLTDDSGDTWRTTYLTAADLDPDANSRPFGGVRFDLVHGDGLIAGEMADAEIGTFASFDNFDVMMHVSDTTDWLVQAIGAPETTFGDQTVVPEPSGVGFLSASGVVLAWAARRGRKRGVA